MIFGADLLFVHVPKTGGMSTSGYLLDVLPKPVYLSHPAEVWNETLPERGVVQIVGKRHETLAEAGDVVARHGFAIDRFPLILATIRNPYDLEVSRYCYLRVGYDWERGPEQDLALASTFEEFAVKNEERGGGWVTSAVTTRHPGTPAAGVASRPYPNEMKDFYTLGGRIPENLRLIRFERLVDDLTEALRSVGVDGRGAVFPWVNRSRREEFRAYYTPRAEEAVYRRYRWVFDRGFYPRLGAAAPSPGPAAGEFDGGALAGGGSWEAVVASGAA
jgi:hypothetical protein